MIHLTEEQLILHYYGESDAGGHLDDCRHCRSQYEKLARVLDVCDGYEVPERPAGYERLLWQKISPAVIARKPWWRVHRGARHWVLAPALAGLLVAVFFAGRYSMHPGSPSRPAANVATTTPISPEGRQRILLVALGNHLERSQMILVELANARPKGSTDIHAAQARAQDLVSENRLYRQTATQEGDNEFTALLDELERVLTDIANGPSDLSSPQLEQIQKRIENRGLIFKIRVVGTNLKQEGTKQL